MKTILLSTLLFFSIQICKAQGNGTIAVPITTNLFFGNVNDSIHFTIIDTLTNQVWYDTLAEVTVAGGFSDTVYLDSATYKCDVVYIGPNVSMPTINLGVNCIAQWGYPDYNYYLFTLPDACLGLTESNSESKINLYPNPLNIDILTVEISDQVKYGTISIFDNLGKLILVKEFSNMGEVTINTTLLKTAVYFLTVESDNVHETLQFCKTSY